MLADMKHCTVENCDRKLVAKGLCDAHYRRQKRGTLPLDAPIRKVLIGVSVEERLRAYVDQRGADECWPWTRWCDEDGYGDICIGGGLSRRAHVVAWEVATGQTCPKGMVVMHTCDNPPCCNPAHLKLGTPTDNNRDRDSKGRSAHQKGSTHGMSKLNEEQVLRIRRQYRRGVRTVDIAEEFSVSTATISLIVNRKTWTHI